ncbi:probable xyloglucan endotransglucosylase/hydrolase protein 33 [Salvia hispanica]|uniref:probable xyloglucan endotransglucosylase/hydrolase protein 33 n=1 Tax=Salvia hispanica TaxID=49212 RepID=UPI002009A6F1|nr:probable xyloglucan endotransglucosylase/hydrolase protein 33 [Salvia hispanica]
MSPSSSSSTQVQTNTADMLEEAVAYVKHLQKEIQLPNFDAFPHNHDENEKRREWVLQTNMYGNGSVKTGREEKFYQWFDPTQGFDDYSILWNNHHIVFLVDNIPVREVIHSNAISPAYPSKPMSVYATIWDGSQWATRAGKYPLDYKYASMGGIQMEGCILKQPVELRPH